LHFLLQGQVAVVVDDVTVVDVTVVDVTVVDVTVVDVTVAVASRCVLIVAVAVNFAFIYTQILFLYTNKYKNKIL
jgi:hypothetical protein